MFGKMSFDIDACGKSTGATLEDDGGDVGAVLDFSEGLLKFESHGKVNYVQGRILETDSRNGCIDFDVNAGWCGSRHSVLIGGKSSRSSRYKLIADLRGSVIVDKGSRAPSFSLIHFFSLRMISSSNSLSFALGKFSSQCCS